MNVNAPSIPFLSVNNHPIENLKLVAHYNIYETKEYSQANQAIHRAEMISTFLYSFGMFHLLSVYNTLKSDTHEVFPLYRAFLCSKPLVIATIAHIHKNYWQNKLDEQKKVIETITQKIASRLNKKHTFDEACYAASVRLKGRTQASFSPISEKGWQDLTVACKIYANKMSSYRSSIAPHLDTLDCQPILTSPYLSMHNSPLRNAYLMAEHDILELDTLKEYKLKRDYSSFAIKPLIVLNAVVFATFYVIATRSNQKEIDFAMISMLACAPMLMAEQTIVKQQNEMIDTKWKEIGQVFNQMRENFNTIKSEFHKANDSNYQSRYQTRLELAKKICVIHLPQNLQSSEWQNLLKVAESLIDASNSNN